MKRVWFGGLQLPADRCNTPWISLYSQLIILWKRMVVFLLFFFFTFLFYYGTWSTLQMKINWQWCQEYIDWTPVSSYELHMMLFYSAINAVNP